MGTSRRALHHSLTLDKELILEAGFSGFAPTALDVNAWPADLIKAKAGELRKVLGGDRTKQAVAFRQRFPRLFVTRVAEHGRKQPPVKQLRTRGPGDPLRVVFLTPVFHVGGAERWICDLCRNFDRAKVIPMGVVVDEHCQIDPVQVRGLPWDVPVFVGSHNLRELAMNADAVISWGMKELGAIAGHLGLPIVNVIHHPPEYKEQEKAAVLMRETLRWASHHVAVSESAALNFPVKMRDQVTVLANGADPARLATVKGREATRRKYGAKPGDRVVLFLGRMSAEKNVATLVRAVGTMGPGWRLWLVGPHQHRRPDVGEAIREVRRGTVRCIPSTEAVGDFYAAADVVALPSRYESHGLTLNEAWLAGVPTVSSDYGQNRAFADNHGELSWLAAVGCWPEELADTIRKAAKAGRRNARVIHARAVAREYYTAAAMARRWENFLTAKVLAK